MNWYKWRSRTVNKNNDISVQAKIATIVPEKLTQIRHCLLYYLDLLPHMFKSNLRSTEDWLLRYYYFIVTPPTSVQKRKEQEELQRSYGWGDGGWWRRRRRRKSINAVPEATQGKRDFCTSTILKANKKVSVPWWQAPNHEESENDYPVAICPSVSQRVSGVIKQLWWNNRTSKWINSVLLGGIGISIATGSEY